MDNLFNLLPVSLIWLLIGIDQYIIGVSAGEEVKKLLELGVNKSLLLGWSYLKTERQNLLLEYTLVRLEGYQVFRTNSDSKSVKCLNNVDFSEVTSIIIVGEGSWYV